MLHQALLATSKPGLTDVTVTIVDRAGTVVVAATPAPLMTGTTSTYAAVVTVPDTLASGRELWSSASGGFSKFPSETITFAAQPVVLSASALAQLRAARITVQAPVLASGELSLNRGDAYKAADGRAIRFEFTGGLIQAVAPRLATVALLIEGAAFSQLGGFQTTPQGITCSFELSAAQTQSLRNSGDYFVRAATTGGDAFDLAKGKMIVGEGSQ